MITGHSLSVLTRRAFTGILRRRTKIWTRELILICASMQETRHPKSTQMCYHLPKRSFVRLLHVCDETLSFPWVKVRSAQFAFCSERKIKSIDFETRVSDTLDELLDVTQQRINNSLELLWAIAQQRSVVPKINASIESVPSPWICDCADVFMVLESKVRLRIYS